MELSNANILQERYLCIPPSYSFVNFQTLTCFKARITSQCKQTGKLKMFIFESLSSVIIASIFAISFAVYAYLKWICTYWERHDFPYVEPRLVFGNLESPFSRTTPPNEELKIFYNHLKAEGAKHGGIYYFTTPVYMPIDLQYIKNILSKDFQYFVERGRYYNEKDDPLSAHLFHLGGTRWKNLRAKFTPTFTSGKMKTMFLTLLECGKDLENAVASRYVQKQPVEIKDFAKKFTSQVIASCVFGLEVNAFTDVDSEFLKYGDMILKGTKGEAAKMAFLFSFPELAKFLRLRRYNKEPTDFFMDVISQTIKYRESNNVRRNDFLQILIDLKNNTEEGDDKNSSQQKYCKNLTMEELAAQTVVFFIAGYDTSATAISFTLYELANNPEIQQKVRNEIIQVMAKHDGKLTYDGIMEMKYMQQVLDETLRKYPSLPILNRQCIKNYKIPDSDLELEKGTQVIISLLGLHHDAEYYPKPDKYDPDRFSPENKNKIPSFAYLPFGDGPRNCIGLRFGVMQTKVGLALLLKDYMYTLNPKTEVPLQMTMSLLLAAKGGIWLDVTKI